MKKVKISCFFLVCIIALNSMQLISANENYTYSRLESDNLIQLNLDTKEKEAILGINPSNYMSDWRKGDMLEKSESMIRREKWVQVKTSAGYVNAGRAIKEDITVYNDLRATIKVNGALQSSKKSGSKVYTNTTKNYNNESNLKSVTIAYACIGNNVVSFYEDKF